MPDYITIITGDFADLEAENVALKKELRSVTNQLLGTKRGAETLRGIRDSLNAEIKSLQDEIGMERVSNKGLADEGYALRDEVETLKRTLKTSKSNTSLVLSCEAGLEKSSRVRAKRSLT